MADDSFGKPPFEDIKEVSFDYILLRIPQVSRIDTRRNFFNLPAFSALPICRETLLLEEAKMISLLKSIDLSIGIFSITNCFRPQK